MVEEIEMSKRGLVFHDFYHRPSAELVSLPSSKHAKASAAGMLMHVHIPTIQPHSSGCSYYFQFMHFSSYLGDGTESTMAAPIHVGPIVQSKGQHALRLAQPKELFQSTVAGSVIEFCLLIQLTEDRVGHDILVTSSDSLAARR